MSDSVLAGRKRLANAIGKHFNGQRDLYEVMGYPRALDVNVMSEGYQRQDIAGRIIDAFPDATWREAPTIEGEKVFVDSWNKLEKKFRLMQVFHRLDRLMGIGHYGILVLGLSGGERMDQPTRGNNYRLIYLQPHGEQTAQVTQWEDNPASPRFGKPKMYNVTSGVNWTGAGAGQKTMMVHHSRVIHVAEKPLEDSAIGLPRLERIWNRLMDLDKLLGGSAEMYWQNSAMILAFIADAEATWEPEEAEQMREQLEEMQNGLRRFLRLRGITPEQLAPGLQGSSPGDHVDKQLDMIAGAIGIPKRILVGSERGELSSAQDENNWAARIAERREQLATPYFIEEFVAAGERLGFLPKGYGSTWWPEADTLGEQGRADIAVKKSQAVAAYVNTIGAEGVVSVEEFRGWIGEEGAAPEIPFEAPIDETNPEAIATMPQGDVAADSVQDTALNGAQIVAVKGIAEAVASGMLPNETGVQLIRAGFPFIPEEQARAIIDPIRPKPVEDVAREPAVVQAMRRWRLNSV